MRRYGRAIVALVAMSAACLISSCGGDTASPGVNDAPEVPGASAAKSTPGGAIPATTVHSVAPPVFSGQALATVRERGLPGGVALQGKVDEFARIAAATEECQSSTRPGDTFLIDMNTDGRYEGISIYTLSQCRIGGDVRVLTVLQQDRQGQWRPVLESALTVGNEPARDILAIDPALGTITVQGAFDAEAGSRMEPEVIAVSQAITPI